MEECGTLPHSEWWTCWWGTLLEKEEEQEEEKVWKRGRWKKRIDIIIIIVINCLKALSRRYTYMHERCMCEGRCWLRTHFHLEQSCSPHALWGSPSPPHLLSPPHPHHLCWMSVTIPVELHTMCSIHSEWNIVGWSKVMHAFDLRIQFMISTA